MTQPLLKKRLSTLDATFLYYERKEAPFHVGSTMIFDGEITAQEFENMLSARLHLLPRYRQKVVPPPFNIGYPSWEFDPDFSIKNHIYAVQLDPPGSLEQLRVLTSQIQAKMLDRAKPLWEIYVVNGLQGHRTAIISKVHHTMVDGVAGVELMNISFDHTPDVPPPAPVSPLPTSRPGPVRDLTGRWLTHLLDSALDITDNFYQLQKGLLDLGSEIVKQSNEVIAKPSHNPLVTLSTPVSVLPFNQPNSGNLDINWHKFSFTEAHSIEERLGGTVNDVMLCAVSGAVIRYLKKHGFDTAQSSLRFFVPVNTRHKEDAVTMGNQVSALPVEVPLRLHNCLERYHHIVTETREMKRARVADQFSLLLNAIGVIPPPVQALVGSMMYTTVPLVNMVCTNVPGPHFPLYILGKKLTDNYSYVPFAYAVGLTCVIFSYNHQLFISLSSDGAKMPGLGREFMRYLGQAFTELRDSAGILSTEIPAVEPLPDEPPAVVEIVEAEPPVEIPEIKVAAPVEIPEMKVAAPPAKRPARRRPPAKPKKVIEKVEAASVVEEINGPEHFEVRLEPTAPAAPETLNEPAVTVAPAAEMAAEDLPPTPPAPPEPDAAGPEGETAVEIPESETFSPETIEANPEIFLPPVEAEPPEIEGKAAPVEAVSQAAEEVSLPAAEVAIVETPGEPVPEVAQVNLEVLKPARPARKKVQPPAQPDEAAALTNAS